jgi:hypothetical protein
MRATLATFGTLNPAELPVSKYRPSARLRKLRITGRECDVAAGCRQVSLYSRCHERALCILHSYLAEPIELAAGILVRWSGAAWVRGRAPETGNGSRHEGEQPLGLVRSTSAGVGSAYGI